MSRPYLEWQRMCAELKDAKENLNKSFPVVQKKFTTKEGPTEQELLDLESAIKVVSDLQTRMSAFAHNPANH